MAYLHSDLTDDTDPLKKKTAGTPDAQTNFSSGTAIGATDWDRLGVTPAQATPGMVVPGQPGKILAHTGSGWEIRDAGQPVSGPVTAPTTPTPTESVTPTAQTQTAAPAPITTIDQATATTVPAGQTVPPGQPTTIAQSFQQALVNRLNPQAVDVTNPAIAPSIAANRLAEQRGLELQQNALAEQAARSGTSMSGGNEALTRGLLADSAARQGQFAGQAVQGLQDQQNANLMAALGLSSDILGQGAGRAQQESQFGRTLAEQQRQSAINAELQRLGISTQGGIAAADTALRRELGTQQANLSLLGLLLSNDQFGRQLAQQGSQFGQSLDQSGLFNLLGLL